MDTRARYFNVFSSIWREISVDFEIGRAQFTSKCCLAQRDDEPELLHFSVPASQYSSLEMGG